MALTNCSMCYLPLPEHEVVSHVSRNHKFDPNFIVYCNQPGCGASYKIWSSFQKHVKREHHMNFNNIDDEDIVDVPEPYQDEDIVDIPESYQDEKNRQDLLRWHASMFIINLKESCSIPQTTVEKVIDGAQQLITEFMSIIKGNRQQDRYVHWDDPNELVDRLRLIEASRGAGNDSHDAEFLSIIEELREAGVIAP
ncbi:hypothetical protein X777_11740 [Ooceraea biroi]|uniref:C2H2-type domain-containing protein n=1 Tax=Ooceraea biroi TaxID=2015173 RepID=A0A026W487_OOCBI|nr:hypothetical protein X777_11740 [Ooceraea biroi]